MKVSWKPRCHVSLEKTEANVAHCKTLGLPYVSCKERPKLAVVGGGPSVSEKIDVLRMWEGDIWACGSAFQWCRTQGIDATYFCIDPGYFPKHHEGAKKAILATCSDPVMFRDDMEIEVFDLVCNDERMNHGVTTMTAIPELSLRMGYRDVTFFGGDSCFKEFTHVYEVPSRPYRIIVKVGDESFETDPEMLMQAELMAKFFEIVPSGILKEESGGLLRALIQYQDYDITHVNDNVRNLLEKSWQTA